LNENDVRRFFDDLANGRFDLLEARLAEDVVLEFPGARFGGVFEGRRRVLVFMRQNQRLFAGGLCFTLHWVGMMEGRAVAQWTNDGTTRGGTPYTNRGVTLFTVNQDRITRIEDYLDTQTLMDYWPA
jgi:ketosteroid isomerase-like protein